MAFNSDSSHLNYIDSLQVFFFQIFCLYYCPPLCSLCVFFFFHDVVFQFRNSIANLELFNQGVYSNLKLQYMDNNTTAMCDKQDSLILKQICEYGLTTILITIRLMLFFMILCLLNHIYFNQLFNIHAIWLLCFNLFV